MNNYTAELFQTSEYGLFLKRAITFRYDEREKEIYVFSTARDNKSVRNGIIEKSTTWDIKKMVHAVNLMQKAIDDRNFHHEKIGLQVSIDERTEKSLQLGF